MSKADSGQPTTAEAAEARQQASMAGGKTDPGKSGPASDAELARLCQAGYERNQVPC